MSPMTTAEIFGPVITGSELEAAVIETLGLWFPTYLRHMESKTGRDPGALPAPRSYSTVNQFPDQLDNQLPAVIVVSPGMSRQPRRAGDGTYQSWWTVGVGLLVSGPTQASTNELTKLYAAAGRTIILQHPSLGGFANGVEWVHEAYDDVPSDGIRTLGTGQEVFSIEVEGVADAMAGPATPTTPPEDTHFVVDDVSVSTVNKEE